MKGRASFKGDTLVFKADYRRARVPDRRRPIRGEPDRGPAPDRRAWADSCGGRRAALVGTWEKS